MHKTKSGFTIVELLIVIVVIGILAAITIVAYNGIQDRAKASRYQNDLGVLTRAVQAGQVNQSKSFLQITGSGHTSGPCFVADGSGGFVYPGSLAKTHACWVGTSAALSAVAAASGANLDSLKNGDPYGAPYYIDENEGEFAECAYDIIGVYKNPMPIATAMDYSYSLRFPTGTTGYNWLRSYARIPRSNSC